MTAFFNRKNEAYYRSKTVNPPYSSFYLSKVANSEFIQKPTAFNIQQFEEIA